MNRAGLRYQNFFLIIASYVFYGWWDWRFLTLIFISTVSDYLLGLFIQHETIDRKRKLGLWASIVINLGILGFFKYFNFFVDSFAELVGAFGMHTDPVTLNIVLPVGISFYTFQTLSYSIDVYRRKIDATKDIVAFFAYVSFFPQLVAGPIERARQFLPQFLEKRSFDVDKAKDGLRQMLWGFFKKVVVADNLAHYVDYIYANSASLDGLTEVLGTFFFAIQVYCDFSGYSDIAIGTGRLFGFSLMRNFAYPFFSRDIAEFWRRWHISLSSWFRDYVYIPMGGSFVSKGRRIWNIVVTFTVSGFWHGANWNMVLWGTLNGLYYIPLMLRDKHKEHMDTVAEKRVFPTFRESWAMLSTFVLTLIGLAVFRTQGLAHACSFLWAVVSKPYLGLGYAQYLEPIGYAMIPLVIEWPQRLKQHGLQIEHFAMPLRWTIYMLLIIGLLVLGNFGSQEFFYFQF